MAKERSFLRTVSIHGTIGAALGILLLHPVTMAIYWFEFHQEHPTLQSIGQFFVQRIYLAFTLRMLLMTLIFAAMGALLSSASGVYAWTVARRDRLLDYLQKELGRDVHSLIDGGEGETIEFKASMRWDFQLSKINTTVEQGITKTIAGFLNHRGGNLLIGVTDSGEIAGLEHDYATFKRRDRDGFQQFLMTLIKTRLGGPACPLIHAIFHAMDGKDVCRVIVEPSDQPIYLSGSDGTAHYFPRTGNVTRELDVQDALQHIAGRRSKR